MKRKEYMLEKIYLEEFITVLIDMHNKGAEYIDLMVYPGTPQDRVDIIVREGYLRKNEDNTLTVDKLNDLLDG